MLNLIEKSPRMEVIEYLLQVRLQFFYFSLEWGSHTSPCHLLFIVNTFRGFKGPFLCSPQLLLCICSTAWQDIWAVCQKDLIMMFSESSEIGNCQSSLCGVPPIGYSSSYYNLMVLGPFLLPNRPSKMTYHLCQSSCFCRYIWGISLQDHQCLSGRIWNSVIIP